MVLVMTNEPTEWLTEPEAAALLKVSVRTVQRWAAKGKLAVYAFPLRGTDARRYLRSDVEQQAEPIRVVS